MTDNPKVYTPYTLPTYSPVGASKELTEQVALMTKFNAVLAQYKKSVKVYNEAKDVYEINWGGYPRETCTQRFISSGVAWLTVSETSYTILANDYVWVTGGKKPYFGFHTVTESVIVSLQRTIKFTASPDIPIESCNMRVYYGQYAQDLQTNYNDLMAAKAEWQKKAKQLENIKKLIAGSSSKKVKDAKDSSGVITGPDDTKPVKMNLPGIKDAYFSEIDSYETDVLFTTSGNRPSVDITKASQLWTDASKTGKGMIQSYIIPNALSNSSTKSSQPELYKITDVNKSRYAFRFIYNPSTISMTFAGSPAVDIGLEISGRDKIPLVGSAASSSTISFQLMINRMQDMKYLTDKKVNHNFKSLYGIDPSDEELNQIRDRGTMYDIEFLLRTLIGYALPSQLRKFTTADIGYLGAYPVELHLGKSLRYLVTISSFDISHTIFTKDMVPVFTNVAITCNRLPDFPYSATTKSALETHYGNSSSSTETQK